MGPCHPMCGHIDCGETRMMARAACRFCGEKIGYGKRFIKARLSGQFAHERCVETALERNDARLGEF